MELTKQLFMELAKEGITAETITVVKNGCECTGIKIINDDERICPIVYYSQDETINEIIRRVKAVAGQKKPEINTRIIIDPDYAREHAILTIRRKGGSGGVGFDILNLEAIVKIEVEMEGETGYLTADQTYLNATGLTAEELIAAALENMKKRLHVYSMAELLDLPEELMEELRNEARVPFYVCTTQERTNGATALCFPEIFKEFCETHQMKQLLLIPSSTEEILIHQMVEIEPNDLAMMVDEINETTVDPLIRLEPVVYRYDYDTNTIAIVADARQAWN